MKNRQTSRNIVQHKDVLVHRKIFPFDPFLELCHLLFFRIQLISPSNAQHSFENSVKATFICNNGFNACMLSQTKGWGWVISLPYNFLFSFIVLNLVFGGLLCICVVLIFSFSNDLRTLRLNKLKFRWMRSHICLPLFKEFPFDNFSSQSCII